MPQKKVYVLNQARFEELGTTVACDEHGAPQECCTVADCCSEKAHLRAIAGKDCPACRLDAGHRIANANSCAVLYLAMCDQ